jgi:cytosine/creatinine deaminase
MLDLLLRNVQILEREPPFSRLPREAAPPVSTAACDIAIQGGTIVAIAPSLQDSSQRTIDCSGMVASPPFVESHIHLDSALVDGGRCDNRSGTLFEGIETWRSIKATRTVEQTLESAYEALQLLMRHGTLYVRTHADVSDPQQRPIRALAQLRDSCQETVTIQVVAFPQDGLLRHDQQLSWMKDAIQSKWADVIGGIPHYELTSELGSRSIQRLVELAIEHSMMMDLHCDEVDDPQSRHLEGLVAEVLLRNGIAGSKVTASHTTAMGSYENGYFNKLQSRLVESKINFVANPLINIVLQGRSDTYPKRRGLTRVKELWQLGCNVSLGNDCIMDPWYALGTGNMLDAAHMAVHVCHMIGRDEINACYDMITWNGADTLGISDYGIRLGGPANLIVLPAKNKFDAIRRRVTPHFVISRGKLLTFDSSEPTSG